MGNKNRSFMLGDEQLDKLEELRLHFRKQDRDRCKDLSEIVREAIDHYFDTVTKVKVHETEGSPKSNHGLSPEALEVRRAYRREYMARYRKEKKEKVAEYRRKWAKANPDKIKANEERYWEKKAKELFQEDCINALETGLCSKEDCAKCDIKG